MKSPNVGPVIEAAVGRSGSKRSPAISKNGLVNSEQREMHKMDRCLNLRVDGGVKGNITVQRMRRRDALRILARSTF